MQSNTVPPTFYRWADHVRACRIDEQLVLLDLRLSKYIGISGPRLAALSPHIAEQHASPAPVAPSPAAGADTLLRQLIDKEMLVETFTAGPPMTPISQPLQSACIDRALPFSRQWLGDFARLAIAAAVASRWLKRLSFEQIKDRVQRQRQPAQSRQDAASLSELADALASYVCLRPFLYTAHDQCLHDSLSLVGFLARRGLFASWIIGVRTRPFAAHSWVQAGSLVLNDEPEHVRTYTPILVV